MLTEQPQDPFLNHALALEEIKEGKDDAARQRFESLLAHTPDYVGSYYHLGKLYERMGEEANAIQVYERGMEIAKKLGDNHAGNELRAAHDNLI